jgi:hypothetical protein
MQRGRIVWTVIVVLLAISLVRVVTEYQTTTYGYGGQVHTVRCANVLERVTGFERQPSGGFVPGGNPPTSSGEVAAYACWERVGSQEGAAGVMLATLVVLGVVGFIGRRRSKGKGEPQYQAWDEPQLEHR